MASEVTERHKLAEDLFHLGRNLDSDWSMERALEKVADFEREVRLDEARLMHPGPCDFRGFKENCLKCKRIASLEGQK